MRADLDVGGVWRRGWHDTARSFRGIVVPALVLGVVAAVFGGLAPSSAEWWQRALAAAGLFVAAFVLVGVAVLAWHTGNAPVAQRDEARERVRELNAELAERDRIDFTIEHATEVLSDAVEWTIPERSGLVTYRRCVAFWVTVKNTGPLAEFVARIHTIDGLGAYTEVNEAAWEHTVEPTKTITRGGRSRLLLAVYARTTAGVGAPPMFWFWGSASAIWSPAQHQMGWRFAILPGARITFELEVTDTTHDKALTGVGSIEWGADSDAVPTFDMVTLAP